MTEHRNIKISRVRKTEDALAQLISEGYKPLFMPEIIYPLTKLPFIATKLLGMYYNRIKRGIIYSFTTPSILAIGYTKQKSLAVVTAHVDNYLSNPDNLAQQRLERDKYHIELPGSSWARMPNKEFQRLVEMDGKKDDKGHTLVSVDDYVSGLFGKVSMKEALEHKQKQIVRFCGSEETAKKFMKKLQEFYGSTNIETWYIREFEADYVKRNQDIVLANILDIGFNEIVEEANLHDFISGKGSGFSKHPLGCRIGIISPFSMTQFIGVKESTIRNLESKVA